MTETTYSLHRDPAWRRKVWAVHSFLNDTVISEMQSQAGALPGFSTSNQYKSASRGNKICSSTHSALLSSSTSPSGCYSLALLHSVQGFSLSPAAVYWACSWCSWSDIFVRPTPLKYSMLLFFVLTGAKKLSYEAAGVCSCVQCRIYMFCRNQ